jgi:hypothetical protein
MDLYCNIVAAAQPIHLSHSHYEQPTPLSSTVPNRVPGLMLGSQAQRVHWRKLRSSEGERSSTFFLIFCLGDCISDRVTCRYQSVFGVTVIFLHTLTVPPLGPKLPLDQSVPPKYLGPLKHQHKVSFKVQ